MKRLLTLLLFAGIILNLGCPFKDDDDKKEDIAIKGTWVNEEANLTLTITNDKWSIKEGENSETALIAEYNNSDKYCILEWEENDYELVKYNKINNEKIEVSFDENTYLTVEEAKASTTTEDQIIFKKNNLQ